MSTAPAAPGIAQSTWLVAEREISTRLRSKAFLISTAILFVIVLASIVIGGLTSQNQDATAVASVGQAGDALEGVDGFEVVDAADEQEAEDLVRSGEVGAAVVPADSPTGVRLVGGEDVPSSLVTAFSIAPEVTLLSPNPADSFLAYIVALGFGVIFMMSAVTFGSVIAQNVVEEKQTRVVEILMSAIPVRALLAGKVIGNSILAFAQIAALAALAVIGLTVVGQNDLLLGLGAPILWFVGFFVVGFVLLAALYAATGSMVSRQEDIGSTTTPVMMLIMLPYFLVVFFYDNPLVTGVMSYVPFSAPVAMPLRLFLGTAQWWEPLVSLVILIVSAVLVIMLGARIYESSLLKMGSRVKWSEAFTR